MTDKEKIRAEIERRITDNTFGAKLELIDILAWLDTLSEEPNKSLEEAAEEYECNLGYYECVNQWPSVAFKAGAEWQKRKMMEGAVEAEVADLNGELYNRCVECGLTDLDKVKIIILSV